MIFDEIYRRNLWNGTDSLSGPGSSFFSTNHLAMWLQNWTQANEISSFLDIGCGDGVWMPDLPGYTGVDVSEEAIKVALKHHPERNYLHAPIGAALPSGHQVVFMRDCLQHLSQEEAFDLLERIDDVEPEWFFTNTYVNGCNVSIKSGIGSYRLNLLLEPFNFDWPDIWIPDGFSHEHLEEYSNRDPFKFMVGWRKK